MKMIWKEWRQQRLLFLLFCATGIAFPLFDGFTWWRINGYFFSDIGYAVVLGFGALFAILLSIATTNSDVKKGVDNFLLSKPIGAYRIFVSKVALAAVLLWTVFMFVSSLDFVSGSTRNHSVSSAWTAICYTHPAAIMLFSVTMLLVVVLRDTAKAALVAIWAALMMYFLPLLLGSLRWMNIFEQMVDTYRRPSLMRYLTWFCSASDKIGGATPQPAMPAYVQHATLFQGLWRTVSSPAYLQYLLFVAVTTAVSIACIVLSVKVMKNRWQWRPGQKTIVWLIGLSAAFIFGVAMLQVGHNLEPVTELEGKRIISPAQFGWNYMPAKLNEGLPEGEWIGEDKMYFEKASDAICFKDDLMFRVSCGYQGKNGQRSGGPNDEVIRHFVLQIYRFPFEDNNEADKKHAPNFVVGAMKFFTTEPVVKNRTQQVLGCFIRNDRLYIAYRPQLHTKNKPIYFSIIDISNPQRPTEVNRIEIKPKQHCYSKAFANYGDYCYLSDGGQMIIISVKEPDKPEIVRTIPYIVGGAKNEEYEYSFDLGDNPCFPSNNFSLVGDKLLCNGQIRTAILDLAEPTKPKVIFDEYFDKGQLNVRGVKAVTFKDNYLYISNRKGIYISELTKQADGKFSSKLVGERMATPIEGLAGRRPDELLFYNGYLVEGAWRFGALVYDVSNPSSPRRVFHAQAHNWVSDIGIWNGLMYMQGYGWKLAFPDIPKAK